METEAFPRTHYLNTGQTLKSWLLTTDHKRIGILYLTVMLTVFSVAVCIGFLMRLEQLWMGGRLFGPRVYNAMFTGSLAVKVGSKALSAGDTSRESLMAYDKDWRASPMGKTIARNWHIKEKFITMSDAKLNAIIHSARAIDLKDFSTLSLIKEIMKRNPLLLADLAGLMAAIK